MNTEGNLGGSENRTQFQQLLARANAETLAGKAAQEAFESECKRNFQSVWDALGEIDAEVKDQGLGSVAVEKNCRQTSSDFELVYGLRCDHHAVPITFAFYNGMADKVDVSFGTQWSRDRHQFALSEVDECKNYIVGLCAYFFRE